MLYGAISTGPRCGAVGPRLWNSKSTGKVCQPLNRMRTERFIAVAATGGTGAPPNSGSNQSTAQDDKPEGQGPWKSIALAAVVALLLDMLFLNVVVPPLFSSSSKDTMETTVPKTPATIKIETKESKGIAKDVKDALPAFIVWGLVAGGSCYAFGKSGSK